MLELLSYDRKKEIKAINVTYILSGGWYDGPPPKQREVEMEKLESKKFIEVSPKSAPGFSLNMVKMVDIHADKIEIKDIEKMFLLSNFIKCIAETVKGVQYELLLSVDDIARLTIIDRPIFEKPEIKPNIDEKE